jgi:hypothetical protein
VTAVDLPRIVTCSYSGYRREFGTAVRITLGIPRWIRLPDPRYSDYARWPYVSELAPRPQWFKAPAEVFDARMLDQLDRLADDIDRKLRAIPPESGALALCCFERRVTGPEMCHRRLVAGWLEHRYGIEVPELDPAP